MIKTMNCVYIKLIGERKAMTKRRDVVKFFTDRGFESKGGTKHEKFTDGKVTIRIKRHREIEDEIFEKLKKQAGLK